MSKASQPPGLAAVRQATSRHQARAADPAVSAWVSANAGTGKTHVLTNRVLRLLVAGTPPERLLCLTYTKAAAAEMAQRVFERLAEWAIADELHLEGALSGLLGRHASAEESRRARDLFTRAIETPGGLKVQTIHAFCERLLQRFPLEAGVAPGFTILDAERQRALVGEAVAGVLAEATADPAAPLGRALGVALRYAVDDAFDSVLIEVLGRRDWLEEAVRLVHGRRQGLEATELVYRSALGLAATDTAASLEKARAGVLSAAELARAHKVLGAGSKSDVSLAADVAAALAATGDAQRAAALKAFFLTGKGEPRARLMTKALNEAEPALAAALEAAQQAFHRHSQLLDRLVVVEATLAALSLGDAAMQRYRELKARRAALDFDDLVRVAGNLLRFGDDAQWVLYKLDGGLDHILVDEAQDTSPSQWSVVEALAREFLAGLGARELETGGARTVFAVGDEKQSIYGFQGAAPHMFAAMGRRFEGLAAAAGLAFERIPLTLSFRTVSPILEAVDRVFADPGRAAGLAASGEPQRHAANRHGVGGRVELWEVEQPEAVEPSPAWSPLDDAAPVPAPRRLAERIAETIAHWVRSGERLVSEDRPIRWGDVLILVRKRRPLADLLVATLKARGIPVAGADRLRLGEQLAVRDVLAILRILLLPEDDLALAALLKSPVFGLDDEDLIALAPGRPGSLWSALVKAAQASPRLAPVADELRRWRARADIAPPYELIAEILVEGGVRRRLIGRLGAEAADPLDELLALALAYDDEAPPSLQGFLAWLEGSEREIKRDMEPGRNEVRVMTVHGAKGLEAPIVILPDTCSGPSGGRRGGLVAYPDMPRPREEVEPFLWPVKGTSHVETVRAARDAARQRESEELNRLLYVALTRPRDRLYVAGYDGGAKRPAGCWYDAIATSLADVLVPATDHAGRSVRRLSTPQIAPAEPSKAAASSVPAPELPPAWALRPAPREPGQPIPVAPSRLAPLETDAEGDPVERAPTTATSDEPPAPSPRRVADDGRFLRGIVTHALLQHLPGLPASGREAAARAFVAARAAGLHSRTQAGIVAETLAVLDDAAFGVVFGPGSRAEVPIAAVLSPPDGRGEALRLSGQIDRLVATDHEVLIVDFKTNRPPPQLVDAVPEAYVLQLAAYRLAVARIFPGRTVRAALLWTDGPRLMELPAARLDAAAARLYDTGAAP